MIKQWSFFDKAGGEWLGEFGHAPRMKQQPAESPQLLATSPETGRIYFAIVVGGAAILLMILAEMKFFGT